MAATKTRTYERELEVALWWRDFRATNNAHFLPLLFDQHRYLVLKGGGGSGKSIFAGRKIILTNLKHFIYEKNQKFTIGRTIYYSKHHATSPEFRGDGCCRRQFWRCSHRSHSNAERHIEWHCDRH